jgi:hypothetical protein
MVQFHHAIELEAQRKTGRTRYRFLSYYALSHAMACGATRDDVHYCERAVAERSFDSQLWGNLAQVYGLIGRRTRALATIEKGLTQDPGDKDLRLLLSRMDRRAKPPLPRLGRGHPVNRLLSRMQGRTRSTH